MRKQRSNKKNFMESTKLMLLFQAGLLLVALCLSNKFQLTHAETREFDWSDLGMSLSGPKTSMAGGSANNLRILVSPQRRLTKNYEFEYSNNSQPMSAQGETTYIMSGSPGGSYSSSQSSGGHSAAYSALSASLASLKNRLSARGVSLTGPDSSSTSSLYSSSQGTHGISDNHSQQQQQGQNPSQPTYLSVGQQEHQTSAGYGSGASSQSNENKTIVLAIPAKINFLTDSRSSASAKPQQTQPQQHTQQVTVIQPPSEQQARPEYSAKQPVLMNTQEASVEQQSQVAGQDQEQQQYVILNSPQQSVEGPQLIASNVATNNGIAQVQSPLFTSVYPASALQQSQLNTFAMKYIPAFQPAVVKQPPQIQRIYTSNEAPSNQDQLGREQQSEAYPGKYSACPDTCDPADPKWRKHNLEKYKNCCSRSAPQYEPPQAQEQMPSPEKVSESSKFADDAYYSYLYRRTRARRSKRPYKSSASRYHKYSSAAAPSSHPDEESSGMSENGSGGSESSGRQSSSSSSSSSGRGHRHESPYMKYYKARSQSMDSSESAKEGQSEYRKERSYRRGRSRDFEATLAESPNQGSEANEEDGAYPEPAPARPQSSGYGSGGDYAAPVEGGRYPASERNPSNEEEEQRSPNYDDSIDSDSPKHSQTSTDVSDYSSDSGADGPTEETEPTVTVSYKNLYRRNRKQNKSRSRKSSKDSHGKYNKRSRKNRYSSKQMQQQQQQQQEHVPTSQANVTDYETAQQPADNQYNQEPTSASSEEENNQKESTGSENAEGEVVSSLSNKYKPNPNESAVANLSKTTMHLKEILSILEKKAQQKANESMLSQTTSTSTPAPTTTTTSVYPLSLMGSQYGSNSASSLPSSFSSDYLTSEYSLKSPYRYSESPSLSSSSLSSLPSSYSSLTSDVYGSPLSYSPTYGLGPPKQYSFSHGTPPRKRRVPSKNIRYNNMMIPKQHGPSASFFQSQSSKSPLLSSYYSFHYPNWYTRGSSSSVTNSYPYKNIHKNPYASLLSGPVSSKLAAAAAASSGYYTDESRVHGMNNYDPLASVTSSLRPSTMRLRSKPFVFQPHVLPIYTRHALLTQPLDVKK